MTPKIKNIIIFTTIAVLLILVYILFINKAPAEQNLVSSSSDGSSSTDTLNQNSVISQNFLSLLLSVNSIKLDDTIFSDGAFINLHDSSILLTPPGLGDEGRTNPFAPIGQEAVLVPPTPIVAPPLTCLLPQVLDTSTNTCITPVVVCTLPKVLNTTTNTCVTPVKCKLPKVLEVSTNTCITPQKTP